LSTRSDPYRILGVSPTAGQEEIRAAYLALLRAHPPEKEPAKFKEIRDAYNRLKDEAARVRTALLHMDLTDPPAEPLFPGAAPDLFRPEDLRAVLLAEVRPAYHEEPDYTIDTEGILDEA